MNNKLAIVLILTSQMLVGSASAAMCVPTEVAQIDSRIHIHCEQAVSDGGQSIWYFALPTSGSGDESKTASRFMAVAMAAISIGKPLDIGFSPGDTSGVSYGCGATDCRKPTRFTLLK